MFTPPETLRTRFHSNLRVSTMHQEQTPPELRGVRTIDQPGCDSFQWFSNTLSSTTTLRAFFSSKRFFTDQTVPALVGTASAVPAAPVSPNSVVVTRQYMACPPVVRP